MVDKLIDSFPRDHPDKESFSRIGSFIDSKKGQFGYLEVKELFRRLTEETKEEGAKNFLGRYKSQLTLDW